MATYTIDGGVPVNNITGTILNGGNAGDNGFGARDLSDVIPDTVSHGSITPGSGATDHLRPATTETGALFNVVQEGHYVAPYMTDGTLAGVAKTVHNTPASDYGRRGIHRLISARRLDVTSWSYLTGAATKGANAGVSYDQYAPEGGTVDDASNPTLGVPGELVYLYGAASGSFDEYPEKHQVN